MKDDILVSVLIPVYGVEKYIENCVRSLFSQSMKEGIEFIFTDDCSPDRSIEILNRVLSEYPDRRTQVRIITHSENQGLAEARVTGLKHASGEYVIHCDSDDWVASDMYEKMYNAAKIADADIVGCDSFHVFTDHTVTRKESFDLDQDQLVTEVVMDRALGGYLWNRMIKRSFYLQGGFRAEKGITLLEDMAVTVPMHATTKRVAYVPEPLYYYRRTDNDTMSAGLSDRNVRSAANVLLNLTNIPLKESWYNAVQTRLKSFLFSRILSFKGRNVEAWRNIELPILNQYNVELKPSLKVAKWLGSHQFDTGLYLYMLLNKLLKPSLWKQRIKKIIR